MKPITLYIDEIDDSVRDESYRGEFMIHAPQPKPTAPIATPFASNASGSVADTGIPSLENMRIRINQMEQTLKNLGLISSK